MMFSKCFLPAIKNRPDTTQAWVVRDRLGRWMNGEFSALWKDAMNMTKRKGRGKKMNIQDLSTQTLMSAGLVEYMPETVKIMRENILQPQFRPFSNSNSHKSKSEK